MLHKTEHVFSAKMNLGAQVWSSSVERWGGGWAGGGRLIRERSLEGRGCQDNAKSHYININQWVGQFCEIVLRKCFVLFKGDLFRLMVLPH